LLSFSDSKTVTEQAAERPFAPLPAAAAILVIGLEVDAFAVAAGLARGAAHAALPVAAGRGATAGCLAYRLTVAAMVQIRVRVDAGHLAGDERKLTAELTFARPTRGRGVRGGHANLAAAAAVGAVARCVHAGAVAGALVAAGQRTTSIFANLARSAGFSACAAVLGIRASIDAAARTVVIARVAS